MTNPTVSGRVVGTQEGADLVLTRRYRAPITDVWASVTEPERTARWFGPWRGEPGPGRTIQVQMSFEDTAPWFDVVIEACEPPRHLAVRVLDEGSPAHLELLLAEHDGITVLEFVDHRPGLDGIADFGCGWEWYLDVLSASREGGERPAFEPYLELRGAYEEIARQAAAEATLQDGRPDSP
jgi:uncharacterized protein YndB with AHSA1/START domain